VVALALMVLLCLEKRVTHLTVVAQRSKLVISNEGNRDQVFRGALFWN
jgi:hypothetical protein